MLANITSIEFQNIFIPLKGKSFPIKQLLPTPPFPQPLETTHLLSVSMNVPILDISYK